MDTKNILAKSDELLNELELIEQRRNQWKEETFHLLLNGLTRLNKSVGIKFSVTSSKSWERYETFRNREFVSISYGPVQSGINHITKDESGDVEDSKRYIIERGTLNYSQAFNGTIDMRIHNPRIEGIIWPSEEHVIYTQSTLEPKDVTSSVVIEHFELLLECLLGFYRYTDPDHWSTGSIGFKQGDPESTDDVKDD